MSTAKQLNPHPFITQNDIKLPFKRREKEFADLTDEEMLSIEKEVVRAFSGG